MVDHRGRIGRDPSQRRGCRRFVAPFGRKVGQLGYPAGNVAAFRVEFSGLSGRIEDAEEGRGVGPASGSPLPAQCVARWVGVDKRVHEPACAFLPWQQQVLDQKGRHDHPDPIVHPSGCPQLTHPRIDDGEAGTSPLPGQAFFGGLTPGKVGLAGIEGLVQRMREVMQEVPAELAPAQLAEPRFRARIRTT